MPQFEVGTPIITKARKLKGVIREIRPNFHRCYRIWIEDEAVFGWGWYSEQEINLAEGNENESIEN